MSYYIEKYGLNREEVEKWGKENYPEFAGNLNLIAQLYLTKVLGITPKPPVPKERVMPVRSLKEGDRAVIRVLVTAKIAERSYTGCPNCRRKIDSNVCPNCGVVTPVEYKWYVYLAGDTSGEIVVSFPPGVDVPEDLVGRVMLLDGTYKDGEFLVTNFDFDDVKRTPTPAPAPAAGSGNINISPQQTTTQVQTTPTPPPVVAVTQPPQQPQTEPPSIPPPSDSSPTAAAGDNSSQQTTIEQSAPQHTQESTEITDPVWEQDKEKFMLLVKFFGGTTISKEEYETWKQRVGIKTPDEVAFQRLGFELTDEGIKIPKLPGGSA